MRISDWSSDVCSSDLRALQEEESGLVVNLATALLLAGDKAALEDLDRRYGTAMAGSPRAETFAMLAGEGAGTAVSSIADKLGKIAVAQDFMASYRQRLKRNTIGRESGRERVCQYR